MSGLSAANTGATKGHAMVMMGDGSSVGGDVYTLGSYKPKPEYDLKHLDGYEEEQATSPRTSCSISSTSPATTGGNNQSGVTPLRPWYELRAWSSNDFTPVEGNIADTDVQLLHTAHHTDPFGVLGPHVFFSEGTEGLVIRAWVKDAQSIWLKTRDDSSSCVVDDEAERAEGWIQMEKRCDWLFQKCFKVSKTQHCPQAKTQNMLGHTRPLYTLQVIYTGDKTQTKYCIGDTYSFQCALPNHDLGLFQSGSCWHVDNLMGSHLMELDGAEGVRFAVWAPNAIFVSLVGDFNQWDGRAHPMRKRHEFGVWELFVPNIATTGQKYGYKIHSRKAQDFVKIDPYAQEFENPPAYASIISSDDDAYKKKEDRYKWGDEAWVERRKALKPNMKRLPMSIYEVHLPSWMRGDGDRYLGYRELSPRLVAHCKQLNFTHVEFLPLTHHPFEGSWGYQVSGFFAPYSRLGKPDDLKYMIDQLHQAGIGVFVDFVPAHFVKDDWGLVYYDGEPCFEYADPREGEHRTWGTMVFNFRRNEVRSFLLGAAYHWLRRYHLDGLRIDAVSSMLYRNYLRDEGDWIPNEFGGDANLEAINMLQEMNWVIHKEFPGVFTMAEEATSWAGVTDKKSGLGFDAKWDLGWMNDTLSYMCSPIDARPSKHSKLTFRGLYMAHEAWVLPLSHDEVVSGKGSLLDKCGFSHSPFEDRLSTLKALFTYQIGLSGRPLIFMGAEFAQGREWSEKRSLDWHESREENRAKCMICLADLLNVYKTELALHAGDDDAWNFKWTECDNAESFVVAWMRNWMEWFNDCLVVCNFGPENRYRFPIGVPHGGEWTVLINTDDWKYGGKMTGPGNGCKVKTTQGGRLGWPYCLWMDVPPFSGMILKSPQPKTDPKTMIMAGRENTTTTIPAELATKAPHDKNNDWIAMKTNEQEDNTAREIQTQTRNDSIDLDAPPGSSSLCSSNRPPSSSFMDAVSDNSANNNP